MGTPKICGIKKEEKEFKIKMNDVGEIVFCDENGEEFKDYPRTTLMGRDGARCNDVNKRLAIEAGTKLSRDNRWDKDEAIQTLHKMLYNYYIGHEEKQEECDNEKECEKEEVDVHWDATLAFRDNNNYEHALFYNQKTKTIRHFIPQKRIREHTKPCYIRVRDIVFDVTKKDGSMILIIKKDQKRGQNGQISITVDEPPIPDGKKMKVREFVDIVQAGLMM